MRPNEPYSIILGKKWGTGEAVTLPLSQLMHTHLIGASGFGKSSLMKSIAVQHIMQGGGVSIIDPAGDISYDILRRLVALGFYEKYPNAFERFVYLDVQRADDMGRYLPFNILSSTPNPYTAANLVLEAFKRIWTALQDGTSTNIELLVKMASFVAAYHKLPLMPYLHYVLSRPPFRQYLLTDIDDTYIREGFTDLGIITKDGRIAEIVQTTIKRSYLLSFAPVVRYALAQQENVLDFGDILRNNRSVALNLHIADPDSKRLLGCLFTVQAEAVAKAWDTHNKREMPYILMIDEMQNFVAQSGQAFEGMFAEARRAGVFVFVAHQYWAQIPLELRGALTQCRIIGTFQVGHEDAIINTGHLKFPIYENWKKPIPFDPTSPMGGRDQYYSEDEQRKKYNGMIEHLPEREAFIRLPHGRFYRMQTLEIPEFTDEKRVQEIEDEYLRRYFRSISEMGEEIDTALEGMQAHFDTSQAQQPNSKPAKGRKQKPHQSSPKLPTPQPTEQNQVKPHLEVQEIGPTPPVRPIVYDDEVAFDNSDLNIPEDDDE